LGEVEFASLGAVGVLHVVGRKVHVTYGIVALKIDPEQIIREIR
jgi:hypothetical protein